MENILNANCEKPNKLDKSSDKSSVEDDSTTKEPAENEEKQILMELRGEKSSSVIVANNNNGSHKRPRMNDDEEGTESRRKIESLQEDKVKQVDDQLVVDEGDKLLLEAAEEEKNLGENDGKIKAEPSLNNIPPEMLLEVLKCISTRELYSLRKVSRKWNELACSNLHHRSDAKVSLNRKKLGELIELYRTSSQLSLLSPFARFVIRRFCGVKTELMEFFKEFGQRIKYLEIDKSANLGDLSQILTVYAPNTQHLSLSGGTNSYPPRNVPLFPHPVELPRLKTLTVARSRSWGRVLVDILKAATNLERVLGWGFRNDCIDKEDIQFWNSMDKLHLLPYFHININDQDLARFWLENPEVISKMRVKNLCLSFRSLQLYDLDKNSEVWVRAAEFLSKIIEDTNKGILQELTLNSLELFADGINWTQFNNVKKLVLEANYEDCLVSYALFHDQPFFPQGIRQMNIFQNLTEIYLTYTGRAGTWQNEKFFPSLDFIPIFPKVRILTISMKICEPSLIQSLSVMCPNLTNLTLERVSFEKVAPAVWTHMKKLTFLKLPLHVPRQLKCKYSKRVISGFTGFSKFQANFLLTKIKDDEDGWKNWTAPINPISSARDFPSIFDLTDLVSLKIIVYGPARQETKTKMMTSLTRLFELEQKDGLQVTITKDD